MEISTMLGAAVEKLVALMEFRVYTELIFTFIILPLFIYVLIKTFKDF